jgi:hypothetical protein
VELMDCLTLWLDLLKWKAKRVLANNNNNNHVGKFYSHTTLTIHLQLAVAYEHEIDKFAKLWCDSDPVYLINEVRAVKEIFEVENADDSVLMLERLNKLSENDIILYPR